MPFKGLDAATLNPGANKQAGHSTIILKRSHSRDKRKQEREQTCLPGVIKISDHKVIDCIIQNYHDGGAGLNTLGVGILPKVFTLEIPLLGWRRRARIAWREGSRMGVAFMDEATTI